MTMQERLKSYDPKPVRGSTAGESSTTAPAVIALGHSVQDELVTMEEIRKKQDDEDEISGKLVFVKGDGDIRQIKGGTIEKLVERLTDGVTYGLRPSLHPAFVSSLLTFFFFSFLLDSQFQQAFMLTFRAFMKQEMLLNLMIQRYDLAIEDPAHPGMSQPIRLRVCNTLKYWLDNFWFDFLDNQQLCDRMFEFVTTKVVKESPKMSDQLNKLIDRKRRGSITVGIQRRDAQPKPISVKT